MFHLVLPENRKPGPIFHRIHRVFILQAAIIFFSVAFPSQAAEFDSGPIETFSENVVLVRGNKGIHELELLGPCLWCEEGLEVLVTFYGVVRATLTPVVDTSSSFRPSPVPVLIIRDGRYEE
jgi:hypothetical protein